MEQVQEVMGALEVLMNDDDLPKSVSLKLECLMKDLKSAEELSLCVNRAISELEELSNDVNIPAFVRTQVWGVLSLLSALEAQLMKAE